MSIIVPSSPTPPGTGGLTCTAWATEADLCSPCDAGFDADLTTRCLAAASDVLFMLSGRRYPGVCVDTVRPIASEPGPDPGRPIRSGWGYGAGAGWWPGWGSYGYWGWPLSAAPGVTEGGAFVAEQPLPGTPVTAVTEVLVDGAVLDAALYRVDDARTLVRLPDPDGTRPGWPACQDLTLPATEQGTWQVTYQYGRQPPPSGVVAAAVLACQLMLALSPDAAGECRLPERVQHITRQGVDAVILDPLAFIDQGRTGLVECDYFLQSVNPDGVTRPASVWRPGMSRRARRTG